MEKKDDYCLVYGWVRATPLIPKKLVNTTVPSQLLLRKVIPSDILFRVNTQELLDQQASDKLKCSIE